MRKVDKTSVQAGNYLFPGAGTVMTVTQGWNECARDSEAWYITLRVAVGGSLRPSAQADPYRYLAVKPWHVRVGTSTFRPR